ncbi:MAG: hypothetical protein A2051_13810 [Desulfovibrionales bacterium GWA2_65_9]|nr:MAG: hypothetical protein A2051_13810 [Desulfovibrionales bacterium GWA2_65_9]
MFQCIKRSELKPGMFVVSYGLGTFDSPIVRVGAHVLNRSEINALIEDDAEQVLIDTSHAVASRPGEHCGAAPVTTSLAEELLIARQLYSEAVSYVKQFMGDVRRGTDIDCSKAMPLMERFVQSVFRNDTAAKTLLKLRCYDEYTYTHSINVSVLAVLLGKQLGLARSKLLMLGLAGLMHDTGKARIPEKILNKPGKLTKSEFLAVQVHPLESYNILRRQRDVPPEVLRAVLEHHERHDGSGYPRGLKGEAISRFSRIIVVADVYDALTSHRTYKEAMAPAKALSLMFQCRGRQYDPEDIDHFVRCLGVFPVGSFVRLSGGEFGIVTSTNAVRPTKPQIKVILDARMRPQLPRVLDLEALEGTPLGQDIAEVLNPADHKIDLERFLGA